MATPDTIPPDPVEQQLGLELHPLVCFGAQKRAVQLHRSGAQFCASIYSLIETAKANGLSPYEYLQHVFEILHTFKDDEFDDAADTGNGKNTAGMNNNYLNVVIEKLNFLADIFISTMHKLLPINKSTRR